MNDRFKTLINSGRPVLVDFYADWCEPCRMMTPVLRMVKKDISDLRLVKVNVDHNPVIAHAWGVHSLPTVMLFKKGKQEWMGIGVQSYPELKEIITNHI